MLHHAHTGGEPYPPPRALLQAREEAAAKLEVRVGHRLGPGVLKPKGFGSRAALERSDSSKQPAGSGVLWRHCTTACGRAGRVGATGCSGLRAGSRQAHALHNVWVWRLQRLQFGQIP